MSQINGNDFNTLVGNRNRKLLKRLMSLKDNVNWDIEEQRVKFICELHHLIKDCTGPLPHFRDILQPKEIDRLLFDVVKFMSQYRLMLEGSSLINLLIRNGYKDEPDPNEDGESSLSRTTPVHFAAASWFSTRNSIVRQLFKVYHRFDVNYTDESGLTHFHVACMCGCYGTVEKFLELGQDPNCLWPLTGESPLYLAVRTKREEMIKLLLKNRADPNLANKEGQTLLHVICNRVQDDAALKKFFEVCDDIRQTIKIDAQDNKGNTPLHLALLCGNDKLAELLLKRGTNPNSANAKGLSPLHITCHTKPDEGLTEKFLKMCDENHRTVQIDARGNLGYTPLHLALYYNNDEVVELLLRRGADPTLADLKGLTALHFCHKHQTNRSVEMLFEISEEKHRKIEVNAQDDEGNTPLHLVMYNGGSEEAIESLLRHGASPNMPNNEGWTPLHLVCRKKDDYTAVETFLKMCDENKRRVKVDARDEFGPTPLQWAVARCWPNIVHVLLDHGADLSNFAFPTASLFDEIIMGFKRINSKLKLKLISGALSVIEALEKRGYKLQRSNVITIMKVFADNGFFEKSADLEKTLCDDEVFAQTAKQILITPKTLHCNKCGNDDEEEEAKEEEGDKEVVKETKKIVESSSLSLYDLISIRSKLTSMVYYEAASAIDSWELSYSYQKACVRHLCEKLLRQFFQSRTLYPFWELIHKRLPIECCEMIIQVLRNEDLLNIVLATASQK
uniref:PRANC domain-containing protein n=1 Tax=Trichogramma kaykai TaxID=54128 RepID=A0ABD2XCP5_9HYME